MKLINEISVLFLLVQCLEAMNAVGAASLSMKGTKGKLIDSRARRNLNSKKNKREKKNKKMRKSSNVNKNKIMKRDRSTRYDQDQREHLEVTRYPVVQLFWALINDPDGCNSGCELVDFFNTTTKAAILHGTSAIPNEDANGEVTLVASVYRTDALVDVQGEETVVDASYEMTAGQLGGSGLNEVDGPLYVAIRVSDDPVSSDPTELLHQLTSYAVDGEWMQYAYWPHSKSGESKVRNWESTTMIDNTQAHLIRQGDVLQVYIKTFVEPIIDKNSVDYTDSIDSMDYSSIDLDARLEDLENEMFESKNDFNDGITESPMATSP